MIYSNSINLQKLNYILLCLLILSGFALRLAFINRTIFHADEFISLLAISSILETGVPRFPSGQLYDKGILYSYLGAGFASLVGYREILIRWVSLWISVITIPLIYHIGYKLFRSRLAGLLAALVMAIYPNAILWGGRIRMYSLAQLLFLLALFLVWLGLNQSVRAYRMAGYGLLFIGLFTHLVLILTIPPLILALILVLKDRHHFNWRLFYRRSPIIEMALVIVIMATLLLVGQLGFDARLAATTVPGQTDEASIDFQMVAASVLDTSEIGSGLESIVNYLDRASNKPLVVLGLIGAVSLLFHYRSRRPGPDETTTSSALLLIVTIACLIIEMVLFLDGKWRHGRYYFLILYPLLTLLAGYGFARLVPLSQSSLDKLGLSKFARLIQPMLLIVLGIWLVTAMMTESFGEINETFKKYRYDLGWSYVAQNMATKDTTISAWPAAAYLYNNHHLDYYANQKVPVVVADLTSDRLIDKYAGATFIYTPSDFNEVIARPGRSWLVIEDARLFNFFEPEYVNNIFHQMSLVQSFDNIHIFVERDDNWPLAIEANVPDSVDLSGQVKYLGYAAQPSPLVSGQPLFLTLFWQPLSPVFNYKIFVHLRTTEGVTVAQADFVPLEGTTTDLLEWVRRQGSDELLRTGTILWLPDDLPPGSYTLWAGMYEPLTLERLPVTDDTTGENAINLGILKIGQ